MGQSKIEVFRHILGDEERAQQANGAFEEHYAAVGAGRATSPRCPARWRRSRRCARPGSRSAWPPASRPATRDALLDALGWRPLIDLALSPADAGRGRPWPDLPLTALLRLGGGAVSELAVAGDTASDVESGLRAGRRPGRRAC